MSFFFSHFSYFPISFTFLTLCVSVFCSSMAFIYQTYAHAQNQVQHRFTTPFVVSSFPETSLHPPPATFGVGPSCPSKRPCSPAATPAGGTMLTPTNNDHIGGNMSLLAIGCSYSKRHDPGHCFAPISALLHEVDASSPALAPPRNVAL